MVEGGHAYAYETVMRCSQPYSMVTAAQRTAAQAMGAVQDGNRAKYQVKVLEVRPPRSRINMNAGEGRPVLQQTRYAGNQPTRQQAEAVQKRRQQAAANGVDWQLCAKVAKESKDREDRKDTGEQGKKKPKKAAAEATKGTKAAKKATGKGPGEGQKGKGKGKGKGGGGSRPAPARAAKRKKRPIVSDSHVDDDDCDSDYAMEYGSKSDLGWGKKARVWP